MLRAAVSHSAIFLCSFFSEGYTALPSRHRLGSPGVGAAPPLTPKHPGPPATCPGAQDGYACVTSAGKPGLPRPDFTCTALCMVQCRWHRLADDSLRPTLTASPGATPASCYATFLVPLSRKSTEFRGCRSIIPCRMPQGSSVQLVAEEPPLRHEFVHVRHETIIVMALQ
jgi:hypothetical protein